MKVIVRGRSSRSGPQKWCRVLKAPPGKTRITIRIDDDVLESFRAQVHAAGGGSYQALINEALRRHIEATEEPLEETLRSVVREELNAEENGNSRDPGDVCTPGTFALHVFHRLPGFRFRGEGAGDSGLVDGRG